MAITRKPAQQPAPLPEDGVLAAFRPISQLIPYARNARTHSPEQVSQIAAALVEFGWTNPVLADATGIVAGHGRAREEYNHSTPKPVELFRIPLVKHLHAGEIAYEPFSGSGPQLIAGEMTARRVFALELAPEFVDVAVLRWQKFTGQLATLDGDGRTFDVIAAERKAKASASPPKPDKPA